MEKMGWQVIKMSYDEMGKIQQHMSQICELKQVL